MLGGTSYYTCQLCSQTLPNVFYLLLSDRVRGPIGKHDGPVVIVGLGKPICPTCAADKEEPQRLIRDELIADRGRHLEFYRYLVQLGGLTDWPAQGQPE